MSKPGRGKPFPPKVYRHGKESITLAADGAIRVKSGHTISMYCACLYGDRMMGWEEFGRIVGTTVKKLDDLNKIRAGETVYHMPTYFATMSATAIGTVAVGSEGSNTTIGDILDEFFSPFSKERLWIMPENGIYTRIVRKWNPVINAVTRTKNHLKMNCSTWVRSYVTNPAWKPTKTDKPKLGAYRDFVPSPPGTDPETCRTAFVVYVTSKAADAVIPGPQPEIQTRKLYTCSIGSFNLYTTVDRVDCAAKTATMDFWMYNNMSRRSFGKFASHPAFHMSGMQSQYMWWNWKESVDWNSGTMRVIPKPEQKRSW